MRHRLAFGFLLTLVLLQGCTTAPATRISGQGGSDLMTESDEPEARKRARIRLELASSYFERGQMTVALDEAKQAIGIDPDFAPAYNLRGLVYTRLNEVKLAEDSFRQALRLAPRDGDTHHNLGWMYCQDGRYEQSYQSFNNALQTPNYASAARTWLTLGICQARDGKPQLAERSLGRAVELDAGNPVTLYNLAYLLHQRGENERARFYIRRLNNSELANASSLWLGIKVERQTGNFDGVRQLGDQLRRRFADSAEANAYERGAFNE